ncbi:MAG TPA: hypothetical protein VL175_03030 [Pirellulales bacterium]|jgi:hypothetical protein|nr:hypothetical protein [Pirellulales bacterium]
MLTANSLRADKNRLASEWQHATRGVTYAPPISRNRPFKTLRLDDRIQEINTVVFGSSTTMSITGEAFPPALKSYNFAQSGNALRSVIGEVEYVVEHWGDRTRLLVVPLDWALGFVYERGEPTPAELTPEAALREGKATRPSLSAELTDALSLPRLRILVDIIREVLKASDKAAAFRQIFIEPAGPEYRCQDGTPARDFDVVFRGMCNGFRYDGSATFADQKRLDTARAQALLATAASGSEQYAAALRRGHGEPNLALLDHLARLAHRLESKGGKLVVLLPPLLPGVEDALAHAPHSGPPLRRTKDALEAWSTRERITILDAGRSERYGCTGTEFIDRHHALPSCYRKVLSSFFSSHPMFVPHSATSR